MKRILTRESGAGLGRGFVVGGVGVAGSGSVVAEAVGTSEMGAGVLVPHPDTSARTSIAAIVSFLVPSRHITGLLPSCGATVRVTLAGSGGPQRQQPMRLPTAFPPTDRAVPQAGEGGLSREMQSS